MAQRLPYFLTIIVLAVGIPVGAVLLFNTDDIMLFEGVEGPDTPTTIQAVSPTSWTKYGGGSESRLSILLTDTNSAWLGLAHGLKSAGIPFAITTDYEEALRHKVILVYPRISGSVLSPEALRALAGVPRNGGTLIGSSVLGGGLQSVFGFEDTIPSRQRYRLHIERSSDLVSPREIELPIGDATREDEAVGTYAYSSPREAPIATYEDGSAAIIHREIGDGYAYALGIDLGALLLKGYNNRQEGFARSFVNEFEPMLDVLLRLLGDIYRKADDRAVILRAVPNAKDLAVVISHDIDYTESLVNAVKYARMERDHGIAATYFIQTKYLKDWNDDIILDENAPVILRELKRMGMELASHSVAHSLSFPVFPIGDGRERYPNYRPFVKEAEVTYDGTVLGELRVSRYLIETLTDIPSVASFRPGHLLISRALPESLAAVGYSYSSSVTANTSLSHRPFQLNYGYDVVSELPVFEFPVTIEDEINPPLGDRLPQAINLARQISRYGGLCMVLIHTDILEHKLDFERGFIEAVKPFSWFGTLNDYGAWWSARNEVLVDAKWQGERLEVRLFAPKPIAGLTLEISPDLRFDPQHEIPLGSQIVEGRVLLAEIDGSQVINFVRR